MIKKAANGVTFIFQSNGRPYSAVGVAGDFNKWSPTPMKRESDGSFQTTLTLAPGEYQFRYCADGEWHNDPYADGEIPNGFGSKNCVVKVVKIEMAKPVAAAPVEAPKPAAPKAEPPKPPIKAKVEPSKRPPGADPGRARV